jgi:hypothetical protein
VLELNHDCPITGIKKSCAHCYIGSFTVRVAAPLSAALSPCRADALAQGIRVARLHHSAVARSRESLVRGTHGNLGCRIVGTNAAGMHAARTHPGSNRDYRDLSSTGHVETHYPFYGSGSKTVTRAFAGCNAVKAYLAYSPTVSLKILQTGTHRKRASVTELYLMLMASSSYLVIEDYLRCRFAYFKLVTHLLDLRSLLFHRCAESLHSRF